jgi:hypothetical protein
MRERTRQILRRNLWLRALPLYLLLWTLIGFLAYVVGVETWADVLITLLGVGVTMNYLDRPLRLRK